MYHVPFTMYNFIKRKQVPMYYFHQTNDFLWKYLEDKKKNITFAALDFVIRTFLLKLKQVLHRLLFSPATCEGCGGITYAFVSYIRIALRLSQLS